jgi:hypothetical protein
LASGPANPSAAPSSQAEIARPAHPARALVASSREIHFPLRFTPSRASRLPLVSLTTRPWLSAPSSTSSRPSSPVPPPIPGHRAPLSSAPQVPSNCYHLAFISPPLIALLNLSSSRQSSMALKPLMTALTAPATPPRRSPGPYKGEHPPRASPHLSPLTFPTLRALAFLSPCADTTEPSPSSPVLLDAARAPVMP